MVIVIIHVCMIFVCSLLFDISNVQQNLPPKANEFQKHYLWWGSFRQPEYTDRTEPNSWLPRQKQHGGNIMAEISFLPSNSFCNVVSTILLLPCFCHFNQPTLTLCSGRFRISRCGGVDFIGGYVSKILHVETKESGPLGGVWRVRPLDPPMPLPLNSTKTTT